MFVQNLSSATLRKYSRESDVIHFETKHDKWEMTMAQFELMVEKVEYLKENGEELLKKYIESRQAINKDIEPFHAVAGFTIFKKGPLVWRITLKISKSCGGYVGGGYYMPMEKVKPDDDEFHYRKDGLFYYEVLNPKDNLNRVLANLKAYNSGGATR